MLRNRLSAVFTTLLGAVALLVLAPSLSAQPLDWSLNAGDRQEVQTTESITTWDEEIINITVADPGVLELEAEGTYIIGLSGSEDVDCGGGSRELPNGWLAHTKGRASVPLRAGAYELRLIPHGTSTVDYRVRADLADVCAGESGDDYGDTALCSEEICVTSSATSGVIGSYTDPDLDFFSFVLDSQASVTIESTGSTDVRAELFNERGKRLAEDDDSGSGVNFQIVQSLPAGRYFVRVEGEGSATGSYSLTVQ